jgi:predicted exporter
VVAIGSNYSLFFEQQNFVSQDRERTVASLLLANISTVIGFGMLSFSHIPVLHGIGMTVAIGAILSLIFSAILTAHGQAVKQ